ncbi:hypothetical protein [Sphingobacterium spiritivorum]|uniref:hypothetical protein n=1 Tax=Sphingobacterium spiritivorum TaxID=258 RepID=UPI00191ADA33|nr:hypothetical protein [Sphingobacterium spiritivorum]QQT25022.1 hypothetical protein I6J02_14995 [Sphingobacterium spiritivorum]
MRILILLLLISLTAQAQKKNEIAVGYADTYDNLPTIKFKKSTKEEYDLCKPAIKPTSLVLKEEKGNMLLPTKQGIVRLQKYTDRAKEDFKGYEYSGYFSGLGMYVVNSIHVAEHIGFSDRILIDSISGYQYAIVSIGDDAVEVPVPSPEENYLLYYYNYIYENNSCFLGILHVNKTAAPEKLLSEKMSFQTKDWAVEEVRWKDDHTIIVKARVVSKENNADKVTYLYYLAELKS